MTDIERENHQTASASPITNQLTDLLKGTIDIVTEYRCEYHPHQAATSVCEICSADICSECSHVRNHMLICRKCMGGLDKVFAGTGFASPLVRVLTHPLVIVLVIAGILGIILFQLGSSHRLGLLGKTPGNIGEAEKQFQLRLLLFARKADRIETHGYALREMGRSEEASGEFCQAKSIFESLIDETRDRWEQPLLMLARARLLQELGEEVYAKGLYENIAAMPDQQKTHSVLAQFHLGKMQERENPEEALKSYKKVLSKIMVIPANIRAAINITPKAGKPYDYNTRLHQFTGNNLNFNDIEAEAQLRIGLLLVSLGRDGSALYRFTQAAEKADDPELRKRALSKERKFRERRMESTNSEDPLKESEEKEKVVITHF